MSLLWQTRDDANGVRAAVALIHVQSVIRDNNGWCRLGLEKSNAVVTIRCSDDEYEDLLQKWNKVQMRFEIAALK